MPVRGTLTFPGDKSISHRALMLGALAAGESIIINLSTGVDVATTRRCLAAAGIHFHSQDDAVTVVGGTFHDPDQPVDCGNSGTTARLLLGLFAGRGLSAAFRGDASLSRRPMRRIIEPLKQMGARLSSREGYLPIRLDRAPLHGITYTPPVASAQVKSALLLAGLGAAGNTTVIEQRPTRDHTEIMLAHLGAEVQVQGNRITIAPLRRPLEPFRMTVPGDPSTAAFFAAAAALVPGSDLILKGINTNPTRIGFFRALERMGTGLEQLQEGEAHGEPVGDYRITPRPLRALRVTAAEVPGLIDELPILAILATQAEGTTVVTGAGELRVKESDRIRAIVQNLQRLGGKVDEREDGFVVHGPTRLHGGSVTTFGDHRIAMAFAVAELITDGPVRLDDRDCVRISCPEFFHLLRQVTA
jgi:3-phosphoshikimate 1-carboxyvinyltransferase